MSKSWLSPLIATSIMAGALLNAPLAMASDEPAIKELAQKVGQKDADALKQLETLAEHGDMVAQDRLGLVYLAGQGVKADYPLARKWLFKSAVQNYAEAESHIAYMYQMGIGTDKNMKESLIWYQMACAHANVASCFNLGVIYEAGKNTPKDIQQAEKMYRKAAEAGLAAAQLNLGLIYLGQEGIDKDYAEANLWINKAVQAGDPKAMYYLGIVYQNGFGVKASDSEAFAWYLKSAEAGYWIAAGIVSDAYKKGSFGLTKDEAKATEWYQKYIADQIHDQSRRGPKH
jgi:TPR repeat protein